MSKAEPMPSKGKDKTDSLKSASENLVPYLIAGLNRRNKDQWKRAVEEVRLHLELARFGYHAKTTEVRPAGKKDLIGAITATKKLHAALQKPGVKERVWAANVGPASDNEVERYKQVWGPWFEYDEMLRNLRRLEQFLKVAESSRPRSTPDWPLRCAVAPLLSLFREHNPGAKLGRGGHGNTRATDFVVAALESIDIPNTDSTVGRLTLDELPFTDW